MKSIRNKILMMLLLVVGAGDPQPTVLRVKAFLNGVERIFYVHESAVQPVPIESAIKDLMAKPGLASLFNAYSDLFCTYEQKTKEEWAQESAKYHHEPQTLDSTLRGGTIITLEDGFKVILPGITQLAGKVVDLQLTESNPGKILDPEGMETELTLAWEIKMDVPLFPLARYGIECVFRGV